MARRIAQVRYYGPNDQRNTSSTTQNKFVSGSIFNPYYPIKQLGIQTLPGVRFRLNNATNYPIIIGHTGIYELELDDKVDIINLAFEGASMRMIADNPEAYLIVDILYESQEDK